VTLNAEVFSIGTLAGAGGIPPDFARRALLWTARQLQSFDHRRPWQVHDLEAQVNHAFADGMRRPRQISNNAETWSSRTARSRGSRGEGWNSNRPVGMRHVL
jgi:hypothetical protein